MRCGGQVMNTFLTGGQGLNNPTTSDWLNQFICLPRSRVFISYDFCAVFKQFKPSQGTLKLNITNGNKLSTYKADYKIRLKLRKLCKTPFYHYDTFLIIRFKKHLIQIIVWYRVTPVWLIVYEARVAKALKSLHHKCFIRDLLRWSKTMSWIPVGSQPIALARRNFYCSI